jgi:DNA repair exonuclease SbcCD nuclease subunit
MSLEAIEVKRAFLISDTHWGARANSMEWFNIMKDFHEKILIPTIKKNYKKGDVLIHLGDMYDNRQNINLLINSYVIDLYTEIGKILPVHILVGNHDLYRKKSNEITSLDGLKNIKNVTVYKNPEQFDWSGRKCLIMPWRRSLEHEVETLTEYADSDYVFCHSEVRGLQLNSKITNKEGCSTTEYRGFKAVYSGHIHYSQQKYNVKMIGNPYQMTRSDINNPKGIYMLDLQTDTESFFENTFSPKFIKVHLLNYLDRTLEDFKKDIANNFVDLYIPAKISVKYNLSALMREIDGLARFIEPNIYDENSYIDTDSISLDSEEIERIYKQFDIMNLCSKYIKSTGFEEDLKNKLLGEVKRLHDECAYQYNMEV